MMKILREILLVTSLFFTSLLVAQDIPEPMYPPRLVNDFSGIFSDSEKNDLEQMLRSYNDTTSTQIYVVAIDDLGGYPTSEYAFKLGEKWGVGQKGKNNGAVILIKPKRKNSRGDVFIAVGYGLEEKLNDARIGRIIDNYMIPYFQQSDYYNGARAAVEAMINYLSGQFQADEDSGGDEDNSIFFIIIMILIIILINYLLNKKGGNNRGNGSSGRGGGFPIIIGGGRSGSGAFGGGGGSFGGGGAGRSW